MKEIITKLEGQIKSIETIIENDKLSFDERFNLTSISIDLEAIVMQLKENIEIEMEDITNEVIDAGKELNNFMLQEQNRLFTEQMNRDMEQHIHCVNMFI